MRSSTAQQIISRKFPFLVSACVILSAIYSNSPATIITQGPWSAQHPDWNAMERTEPNWYLTRFPKALSSRSALMSFARSEDPAIRERAVRTMSWIRDPSFCPLLRSLTNDPYGRVRASALESLVACCGRTANVDVLQAFSDVDIHVLRAAVLVAPEVMLPAQRSDFIRLCKALCRSLDYLLRGFSLSSLYMISQEDGRSEAKKMVGDASNFVRSTANSILREKARRT